MKGVLPLAAGLDMPEIAALVQPNTTFAEEVAV
jgi:hypothetical protein